jgi:hypothetical protein
LYFLLPDKAHALALVNDLVENGIHHEYLHALAGQTVQLDGLPTATRRQNDDIGRRIETLLLNGNLVVFGLTLGSFADLLVTSGLTAWLMIPAGIALATFLAGHCFTRVPSTHLDEFRDAMAHGEILLMVDDAETRVADIDDRAHRHHPEAAVGGIGWGTTAFCL